MKIVKEIYNDYTIPKELQEHQLRVAGISKWILDNWHGEALDKEKIIFVALFHDMANIIKFDFSPERCPFPYTEEERTYWQEVQREFINKYRQDVHRATQIIVEEISNPHNIAPIVGGLGFRNAGKFLKEMDYISMIVQYADMRVSPYKVETLTNRLNDFYKRYETREDYEKLYPERESAKVAIYEIEKILVVHTSERLLVLTDEDIEPTMKELRLLTL